VPLVVDGDGSRFEDLITEQVLPADLSSVTQGDQQGSRRGSSTRRGGTWARHWGSICAGPCVLRRAAADAACSACIRGPSSGVSG
jgi:hypothetical protein